jgi:signal transduction histidine kinase
LTTILSSLFLLENSTEEDQDKVRTFHYQRIRKSTKNLIEILNDFLSLSKLEEGKIQPAHQVTNIPDLIREIIEGTQAVKKEQQEISYTHLGEHEWFSLDGKFLKNILINLLANAFKFSPPEGKIEVLSRFEGDRIRIEVTDQGIGIPEEEQPHLFNRFFRAKNAQNIEGTGLGLSIVKKYVDLMKGSIELISHLNQGTKFTLIFPNHSGEND